MNKKVLTTRQGLKMCLIENLSLGCFLIPYICVRVCGKAHTTAVVAGMLFICAYIFIMYLYSKLFDDDFLVSIKDYLKFWSKPVYIIYIFRYLVKGAVVIAIFSLIIQKYALNEMGIWWIIASFLILCLYGALRNLKKRGRMLELLFWWMFIPLILVAVGAVNLINWQDLVNEFNLLDTNNSIKAGGYILFFMSGLELMIYNFGNQKENNLCNTIKLIIWVLGSVFLIYVFAFGILGGSWISAMGVGNSLENSVSFPARLVQGYDLFSLMFLLIGAFAISSAYIFYAKEMSLKLFKDEEKIKQPVLVVVLGLIVALIIALAVSFDWSFISQKIIDVVVYSDLIIGLVVPIIVWGVKKYDK